MNFKDFTEVWDFICDEQIAERKHYLLAEQVDVYIKFLKGKPEDRVEIDHAKVIHERPMPVIEWDSIKQNFQPIKQEQEL